MVVYVGRFQGRSCVKFWWVMVQLLGRNLLVIIMRFETISDTSLQKENLCLPSVTKRSSKEEKAGGRRYNLTNSYRAKW